MAIAVSYSCSTVNEDQDRLRDKDDSSLSRCPQRANVNGLNAKAHILGHHATNGILNDSVSHSTSNIIPRIRQLYGLAVASQSQQAGEPLASDLSVASVSPLIQAWGTRPGNLPSGMRGVMKRVVIERAGNSLEDGSTISV